MDNTLTSQSTLKQTRDYDSFSFMANNRETNLGHVEALKRAFDEYGNLTKVQPVLVNENLEIIDGQHRFLACKELGEPIFYNIVPGLGIQEARKMNILHRGWSADDYARSYAESGNQHYQRYVELKEEFGFSHSVMLLAVYTGREHKGIYAIFREGDMNIAHLPSVMERLELLSEVRNIVGNRLGGEKVFCQAVLRVSQAAGFSRDRLLKKLIERRDFLRRYTSIEDALRQLEEVFNFNYGEANRVRLY